MEGWVKLYRELLEKAVWKLSTPEQRVVLITILLLVNHKPEQWEYKGQVFTCEPGQKVTSLNSLAEACGKGISVQNVRSAISRFVKLGFLTDQPTNTGRLITVVNWGKYQAKKDEPNKPTTDHSADQSTECQQSGNKEVTPNKNDMNDTNDKEKRKEMMRERSFDFEKFWHFTADAYPKQRKVSDAKDLWIDEILKAPIGKEEETARIFYKAIESYKEHMEGIYSKPDDRHNATPQFREWILSDSEQWLWKAKIKIQSERAEKTKAAADNVGMTEEEWNSLPDYKK